MEFEELQSYARSLNTLNSQGSVTQGKQLHLLFLKRGLLFSTISIANRLLQMYVRCGRMGDAEVLFDEMPQRNCFAWNTILEGYASMGNKDELRKFFHSMPQRDEFSWNVVLSGLVRQGGLDEAQRLFNEMPWKNGIAWNTMIHGNARNGRSRTSLVLFKDLLKWETREKGYAQSCDDPFILATVIGACSELEDVELGKQVHTRIIVKNVEFDSVLRSSLVNMYGKCGDLDGAYRLLITMDDPDVYSLSSLISGYSCASRIVEARRLFEGISNPCVVLWNSIISGYVANNKAMEALTLYKRMHKDGVQGDFTTFSSILRACSSLGVLRNCIQLHPLVHKLGTISDHFVAGALVDSYSKCGSPADACDLFGELKSYDTVLLNSMITIFCDCCRIDEARLIFNDMKSKSLVTWNAMIVGFSQNGYPMEALELFCTMNDRNINMDSYSLASAISACGAISLLELGEQIFARAAVIGLELDQIIVTSLIDFYCKCGLVGTGRKLFDLLIEIDAICWNTMLMGYATNGYSHEVLELFHDMRRKETIKPTEVTFTAVLSACDHCGLVEEGKHWFSIMKHDYHIDPGIEHYSCMIDLLARVGRLQEAIDLLEEIPHQADADMWSAILRGCIDSGDQCLSKKVADRIINLDPQNSGALVQLSGALASTGDWKESALVRQMVREKSPGRSWCNI